ncbi:DUF4926 domain-containing protein [Oculatella sp. FACHB-28]|uniref:DUF4926 domain-containing protein n=1 Tax=Oculatella sp. FACHB-28 TaxID=2692845 RepID=UPI00168A3DDF|nr:DUF4926 domain-containing protein [Oculatella sp. FACHB-28]MBD1867795.1 DUF4926 domain-containing protein [Cyanobacteria bacterium FACHB-471]MBD2058028.1 DUF4926 domain-containing protein [Oculatella sp. FACHB-28]
MDFELYTDVVLLQDIPEENLRAGDIGVVVDRHDIEGIEPGYSLKFFDMLGETIAVVTLAGSLLRVPTHADRPTVRSEAMSA